MTSRRSHAGRLVLVASLVAILSLTLMPESRAGPILPIWCLRCGRFDLLDMLLNLALFLPFGVGLCLTSVRRTRALLAGFALSATIETLQLVIPGRDASARDVAMNTLGTLAGMWLAEHWRAWLLPSGRRAVAALLTYACGWLLFVAACGWALQQQLPAGPFVWRTVPLLGAPAPFEGTVWRADARDGAPGAVDVAFVVRRQSVGRRTIAQFVGRDDAEAFMLMSRGRDLLFRRRLRAVSLTLRSATLRFDGVLPPEGAGADSVRTLLTLDDSRVRLDLSIDGRHVARTAALSPALGWALFLPFEWPLGPSARLVSLAWIAALLLPLGHLGRRARGVLPASAVAACLGATMLVGLLLIPMRFDPAAARADEWLVALVALAVGWRIEASLAPRVAATLDAAALPVQHDARRMVPRQE